MSHSHDPYGTANPDAGYGGGGRTSRPLWALMPIGIGLALAVAMLVAGVHVMTTPSDTAAGEAHIAQTAVPAPAPGRTS